MATNKKTAQQLAREAFLQKSGGKVRELTGSNFFDFNEIPFVTGTYKGMESITGKFGTKDQPSIETEEGVFILPPHAELCYKLKTVAVGTEVFIEHTGAKPTEKGNDQQTYDVICS